MNKESLAMEKDDSYFERNLKWLAPALGTVMATVSPILVRSLDVPVLLPAWLPLLAGVLGSFLTGFAAMQVDTASARIVRLVGSSLGLSFFLYLIFR